MKKSTSALSKEIRDSAEQAANLTKRLQKIRVDLCLIFSGWAVGNEKNNFAIVEWKGTLRELDGHFITIRDQYFTNTAQADISPESLKDLSKVVDIATSDLQISIDQLSSRHKLCGTTEINQITTRLRRHADGIYRALRSFTDELQDQTGTRPLSRYIPNIIVSPSAFNLNHRADRMPLSRTPQPQIQWKVRKSGNNHTPYSPVQFEEGILKNRL
jgi:hypothetical protein